MNITPQIAFQEQAIQNQFLQERILALAQALADMTAERDAAVTERDQAIADRDALRAKSEGLEADLRDERLARDWATDKLEATDGIAE